MEIIPVSGFENVFMVDCFQNELTALFKDSKNQLKQFSKFLMANLHSLENRDDLLASAEKVKGTKYKLFSIHKRMNKNTRVLYFCSCGNTIVLITAFDEKNWADYGKAIKRAENRVWRLGLQ